MKTPFLVAFSTLLLLQSCAPGKNLRQSMSYQPGYNMTYRYKTVTETSTEVMGEIQNQFSTNQVDYKIEVVDHDKAGATNWLIDIVHMRYESEEGQAEPFEYDSSDPNRDTSQMRVKMFDAMIGHRMFMTTTSNGDVTSCSGADEMIDKMIEPVKHLPGLEPMMATLKGSYGDSAMMESFRYIWTSIPIKPVRVGQKLQTKRKTGGMIAMDATNTYTLKSWSPTEAVLKTTTKVKTLPNAQMDMGFVKILYDMEGAGAGESVLSQPDGNVKAGRNTLEMKGVMHLSGSGIPKMDAPITTKAVVTIERIDN
ncbi:MAG: hypothetical protein JNJ57_05460 [Saprospiraceae bacterium]|nr:hypothetical protein [Saprospiraceae bacterium]